MLDQIEKDLAKARGGKVEGQPAERIGVVKAITESAGYKGFIDGANSTGRIALPGMTVKDLISTQSQEGTSPPQTGGYPVAAQRVDGLFANPMPALPLLSLIPSIAVGSNSIEYVKLDGYSNAADYQLREGNTKAEGSMPTALATADIATIAHWVKASRQVMADAPGLAGELQRLLIYGLGAKLQNELLNGPAST